MVHEPIKPSTYIHIVCNMTAKDYLPKDLPTFKTKGFITTRWNVDPLTPEQEHFFLEEGFTCLSGLTRKQGIKLQKLVEERKQKNLASPTQINYLMNTPPYKKLKQDEKYICLSCLTVDLADIMIRTIEM